MRIFHLPISGTEWLSAIHLKLGPAYYAKPSVSSIFIFFFFFQLADTGEVFLVLQVWLVEKGHVAWVGIVRSHQPTKLELSGPAQMHSSIYCFHLDMLDFIAG